MKKSFALLLMLNLQACSGLNAFSNAMSGDFLPLTPASTNQEAFQRDRANCFKQVESEVGKLVNENFAIIKFRDCLIQKGYLLLS
jgi:hypothetical protein